MRTRRHSGRLAANIFAIALLLAAQFGTAVHAFDHDLDTPQVKVCGACIVVSQLGAACAGTAPPVELPAARHVLATAAETERPLLAVGAPRQRGPPIVFA